MTTNDPGKKYFMGQAAKLMTTNDSRFNDNIMHKVQEYSALQSFRADTN